MRTRFNEFTDMLARRAHVRHRVAEENGHKQDLQQVSRSGKGIEKRRGDHMQDQIRCALGRRSLGVIGYGVSIQRPWVGVETSAGSDDIHNNQSDDQCERGDDLEIDERLPPNPANLFHVSSTGNS